MHKISTSNKRIAKNTLFLYIRMVFVLLVSLYSTRAILNALGVVDYGIYNVVAGFVVMFAFLNSSRLILYNDSSTLREEKKTRIILIRYISHQYKSKLHLVLLL